MTQLQENAKRKILCIEDEEDLRENIAMILSEEGYEVIEAVDGEDGYNKFISNKPDLVLCDINMPKLTGHELLTKLKDDYPETLNQIPFIYLTAFGQKNDFIKGIDLGADEYVVKPIDFDILITLVKSKIGKATKIEESSKRKLEQFSEQVSDLIPNQVKEPMENLISLASTLKKESNSAFADSRYVDMANRLYMAAINVNYQLNKILSKDSIKNEVNNLQEYIDIVVLLKEIKHHFTGKNLKFAVAPKLPKLRANRESLKKFFIDYLNSLLNSNVDEIILNSFLDYQNNMVFSFTSKNKLGELSSDLKSVMNNINAQFSLLDKEDKTYHLIMFPKFLVKIEE